MWHVILFVKYCGCLILSDVPVCRVSAPGLSSPEPELWVQPLTGLQPGQTRAGWPGQGTHCQHSCQSLALPLLPVLPVLPLPWLGWQLTQTWVMSTFHVIMPISLHTSYNSQEKWFILNRLHLCYFLWCLIQKPSRIKLSSYLNCQL